LCALRLVGNYFRHTPAISDLADDAEATVAPLVSQIIGAANGPITRTERPAGEAAMGNFITGGTNRVGGPVDLDALITDVGSLPRPFDATMKGRNTRLP
jgi:hypothetical protein